MKIHHSSTFDIDVVGVTMTMNGRTQVLDLSAYPWSAKIWSGPGIAPLDERHYRTAHFRDGVWSSAQPLADGGVRITVDGGLFVPGKVWVEIAVWLPDATVASGERVVKTTIASDLVIALTGATTLEGNNALRVVIPAVWMSSYDVAVAHGYTGTPGDYEALLVGLPGLADDARRAADCAEAATARAMDAADAANNAADAANNATATLGEAEEQIHGVVDAALHATALGESRLVEATAIAQAARDQAREVADQATAFLADAEQATAAFRDARDAVMDAVSAAETAAEAAETYATAAQDAATATATSAEHARQSAEDASSAKQGAEEAYTLAVRAKDDAASYRDEAQDYADDAHQSRDDAQAYRDEAQEARDAAMAAAQSNATAAMAEKLREMEIAADWERIDAARRELSGQDRMRFLLKAGTSCNYYGSIYSASSSHDTWIDAPCRVNGQDNMGWENVIAFAYLDRYSPWTGAWRHPSFQFLRGVKTLRCIYDSDMSACTSLWGRFAYCNSLEEMDCSRWDVPNLNNLGGFFEYCYSLRWADISNFHTANLDANGLDNTFVECHALRWVTLGEGLFETTLPWQFHQAENLGFNEDGTDNGWLRHLAETAPTITDGQARTIRLHAALRTAPWAAEWLTILRDKGYTIA